LVVSKNPLIPKPYTKIGDKYYQRKDKECVYCEKRVYKQYIEHLKNPQLVPMPKFSYEKKVINPETKKEEIINLPKNF